ncbi:peptidase U32 family protein [Mucispirillum schaedleri]|uniref:peptidase U32 family protein n=1 Tax=Mucispirillum schaedleri TaxID=248039 RepID=UPI001F577146|nr:U32 family peptidase [Mucispirillum schaedleri]
MELLSPAGNFEKLKAAVRFGADAVFMGGPAFGLRANAGNFSFDEMEEAFKYLHDRGKKGYVTVNIYPQTNELESIRQYLKKCEQLGADALIISDPGIFSIVKQEGIKTPVSISTQANTTNLAAVNFWASLGASRVIMAREVRKEDLVEIMKNAQCEVETFIHGAICISMSGRCLISSYMTGKDANNGECTHPCRWNYALMEEKRDGEYFPVYEDDRGTYLYNSKDLCLLDRIGELVKMGSASGKIEGRMKSIMYVSIVTGVYRQAIDSAVKDADNYKPLPEWRHLLESVSNRGYIEGFYGGEYDTNAVNRETSGYSRSAAFLGVALKDSSNDELEITCRAKFAPDEEITILTPDLKKIKVIPEIVLDEGNNKVEATRPNYIYKIPFKDKAPEGSLIMRF